MTDEEILKAFQLCNTDTDCDTNGCPYNDMVEDCISMLNNDIISRFNELKAENAALRERLERAVELPCRIGDTLYGVYNDKVAEYIVIGLNVLADWTLEIYLKTQNKNKRQNRFSTFSTSIGIRYFKDREAAEAKLAELKGGKER